MMLLRLLLLLLLQDYRRKLADVREEILRKRRAGNRMN
jgi:hypothetical protein